MLFCEKHFWFFRNCARFLEIDKKKGKEIKGYIKGKLKGTDIVAYHLGDNQKTKFSSQLLIAFPLNQRSHSDRTNLNQ